MGLGMVKVLTNIELRKMTKTNYLLFVILTPVILFSQEVLIEKTLPNNFKAKEVFQITGFKNEEFAFLIQGNQDNISYLYEKDFTLKDSVSTISLPKKYGTLLGTQIAEDNSYLLFFSNTDSSKYGVVKISFNGSNSFSKELDLKFGKERFLESIEVDNKVMIITITKKSNILNFYQFDDEGNHIKTVLNCSDITFRNWDGKGIDLDEIFTPLMINQNLPNSVKSASRTSKLYIKNHTLYFTLDIHKDFTQILTVDLDHWEKKYTGFMKPKIKVMDYGRKHNSFLFEDKYFGLALHKDTIKLEIKDINTKELIKTQTIVNNKPIEIKNSPIIIMDGPYKDYREVENTTQFFRKISNYGIGVSVSKYNNDLYEIQLGGIIPETQVAIGPNGLGGFGPVSSYSANIAYQNVVGGRMTYIKCLLNSKFENSEGEIKQNAFEKIKLYSDGLKNPDSKYIIPYKNDILVSHLTDTNKFLLVKFENGSSSN